MLLTARPLQEMAELAAEDSDLGRLEPTVAWSAVVWTVRLCAWPGPVHGADGRPSRSRGQRSQIVVPVAYRG